MTYGTNAGATADDTVKLFGIEDFWGNRYQWVDGFMTGGDAIKIADGNFNDTGDGYEVFSDMNISIVGSNIKDVVGTNKLGFTPKLGGGSTSTYYCDITVVMTSSAYVPGFGGYHGDGADAGAFRLYCDFSASGAFPLIGARLCFCG